MKPAEQHRERPAKLPLPKQNNSDQRLPYGLWSAAVLICGIGTALWLSGVDLKHLWLSTSDVTYPRDDNFQWTLTTETFTPNRYQCAPYVSNGYFGQTLPAEGAGYWVERKADGSPALNGWPLDQERATFGTVAGFWNLQTKVKHPTLPENVLRGGESVISGLPDWTGLVITTDSGVSYKPGVEASTVHQYSQSQSIRDGVVNTNVMWRPEHDKSPFQLNFTVLAHHRRLNLGLVRLDVTVTGPCNFTLTDVLDGAGASRANFGDKGFVDDAEELIWTSVKPWGVERTTAYVASRVAISGLTSREAAAVKGSRRDATSQEDVASQNLSSIAQSWQIDLQAKGARTMSIVKYVGIASTDAFPSHAHSVAIKSATDSSAISWDQLLHEHRSSWEEVWDNADIVVPENYEVQTTVRASLFHLLSNTVGVDSPKGITENSIPVGGLTSDSYGGLVFWDSDVWMYPPLQALHPPRAEPILNYRQRLLSQAEENAQSYSRPGALYPWTSGRYGNCTGTGLCVWYQYHLNTGIAMAHWNRYLYSGDKNWLREKAWPIIKSVADMFAQYVVLNKESGEYDTIFLGEPDEFAYAINNGAYTNVGIKKLLGEWAPAAAAVIGHGEIPSNWSTIAEKIKIPYDSDGQIMIEHDGMDGEVKIKQASVTLVSYPLRWRISEQQALNDMAFYSRATTANGPAMTWAIYAISSLHLHQTGCAAYTYMLQASQPYLRAPFYQFSEQQTDTWSWADAAAGAGATLDDMSSHFGETDHTSAAFPFLTGYGGYLQIFTHGFTGMQAVIDQETGGIVLVVDPVMVPQLTEGIKVRGVKFHDAVLDFDIGPTETVISRRPGIGPLYQSGGPITLRFIDKKTGPVDYVVRPTESIRLPTRRPDLNSTAIAGNMVQCAAVRSVSSSSSSQLAPWVTGRHPVAAVDGSNDTVWQPQSPEMEASIVVELGEMKLIKGMLVNWAAAPATEFTLEGQTGAKETLDSQAWEHIYGTNSVAISAPYDPERAKRIVVPDANVTSVKFDIAWNAQRVRFTIRGSQGTDKTVGATVAELAILG